MPTKKEVKKGEAPKPAAPTRQERMRYNQYTKKMLRGGGTPAPMKQWLQTQRGK